VQIDKFDLTEPPNTAENREKLARIIVHDMSAREMKEKMKEHLVNKYKISKTTFLKEYWKYYEESWGHCPLGVNGD